MNSYIYIYIYIYIYFHGPILSLAIGKQWKLNDLDNMVSVISPCLPFQGMPMSTKSVVWNKAASLEAIVSCPLLMFGYLYTSTKILLILLIQCFHIRKNLLLFFMTLFPVPIPSHFHLYHRISFSIFTHITKSVCIFIEFALTL